MNFATYAGLFAVFVWSAAVAIAGVLTDAFGAYTAAALELLIAGVVLFVIELYKKTYLKIKFHSSKYFLICGTFWLINVIFFWLAVGLVVNNSERVVIGLINYLWPIFTILFSIPILKRQVRPLLWVGLICSIVSIIVSKVAITSDFSEVMNSLFMPENQLAYLLIFLCAVAWALYSNFATIFANPEGSSPVYLFMLIAGMLLLIIFGFDNNYNPNRTDYVILFIWSVLGGFAYLGWDIGMRKGSQHVINSAALLIPFVSTLLTAVFNNVSINIVLLVAGALAVMGALFAKRGVVAT